MSVAIVYVFPFKLNDWVEVMLILTIELMDQLRAFQCTT